MIEVVMWWCHRVKVQARRSAPAMSEREVESRSVHNVATVLSYKSRMVDRRIIRGAMIDT